jgi:hypothetical protein
VRGFDPGDSNALTKTFVSRTQRNHAPFRRESLTPGLVYYMDTRSILSPGGRPMCGILGYFRKGGGTDAQLGATMLSMLEALGRRGPDSAGVALVGPAHRAAYIVCVQAGDELEMSKQAIEANREAIQIFARALHGAYDVSCSGAYVRFVLAGDADLPGLTSAIESLGEGIEVLSIGHAMELSKEVGSPHLLEGKHHISAFAGSHGIGHTRLCTESTVDLSHSQPFWGRGAADVAIVHNGHITNYHQMRRKYDSCLSGRKVLLLAAQPRCPIGDTQSADYHTTGRIVQVFRVRIEELQYDPDYLGVTVRIG